MNDQIQIVLIAAGCTSAVGLAGMGVIRLLRRASLRLSIQASAVVPVLAIVAARSAPPRRCSCPSTISASS